MIGVDSDFGIRCNEAGETIPNVLYFFMTQYIEMMMSDRKQRYGVRNRERNPTARQASRRKALRLERASSSLDRNAENLK